jgi:hypothetical protein
MLWWLVDHADLMFLVLGIAALVLGCLWWMRRQRWQLTGLVVVLGLFALLWILTDWVVTDRKQIVQTVQRMADAVRSRDLDTFFQHVSPQFEYGGMGPELFRAYVDRQVRRYPVSSFRVSKVDTENVSREERKGTAEFWIFLEEEIQAPPLRCEATFLLQENRWRLGGFKLFLANSKTEYRLPDLR